MSAQIEFHDRMLSLGLARVAEQAALASANWVGRGDEKSADQAAVNAMREQLNMLEIAGVVVIGEGERDEAPMLYIGEEVGTGSGPGVDIALDPLEGTTSIRMRRLVVSSPPCSSQGNKSKDMTCCSYVLGRSVAKSTPCVALSDLSNQTLTARMSASHVSSVKFKATFWMVTLEPGINATGTSLPAKEA